MIPEVCGGTLSLKCSLVRSAASVNRQQKWTSSFLSIRCISSWCVRCTWHVMCLRVHITFECVCGGQSPISDVFLSHSSAYFLRQALSLNLKTIDLTVARVHPSLPFSTEVPWACCHTQILLDFWGCELRRPCFCVRTFTDFAISPAQAVLFTLFTITHLSVCSIQISITVNMENNDYNINSMWWFSSPRASKSNNILA